MEDMRLPTIQNADHRPVKLEAHEQRRQGRAKHRGGEGVITADGRTFEEGKQADATAKKTQLRFPQDLGGRPPAALIRAPLCQLEMPARALGTSLLFQSLCCLFRRLNTARVLWEAAAPALTVALTFPCQLLC